MQKEKSEEMQMFLDKMILVPKIREMVDEEMIRGEGVYMSLVRIKYYANSGKAEKISEDVVFIAKTLSEKVAELDNQLISNIVIGLTITAYDLNLRSLILSNLTLLQVFSNLFSLKDPLLTFPILTFLQVLLRSDLYDHLPFKALEFKSSKVSSEYSYQQILEFKKILLQNKSSMLLSTSVTNLFSTYPPEPEVSLL